MRIGLGTRTAETAAEYFHRTNSDAFRRVLPQKAKTAAEAVADFEETQKPDAASYGRIILADARYIGDVWCYCISRDGAPNAMLSYCVFEEELRGKGAATEAVRQFIDEVVDKYGLRTMGAFTFSSNAASIRVLEKNGFRLIEEFEENGVLSKYFERRV